VIDGGGVIALADTIRDYNTHHPAKESFNSVQLNYLARFCKEQNPRFNQERWLDYIWFKCGPNGGCA
jgi:hypothetical protein